MTRLDLTEAYEKVVKESEFHERRLANTLSDVPMLAAVVATMRLSIGAWAGRMSEASAKPEAILKIWLTMAIYNLEDWGFGAEDIYLVLRQLVGAFEHHEGTGKTKVVWEP